MTTSQDQDRPLRADAERNRQRILDAAAEVFAQRGLDVSLDEIAAQAGVGVGTVYRRFPNKDALIDALFEAKIGRVVAVAEEALRVEDPLEGLKHLMFGVCELHATDLGLKETIMRRDRGSVRVARGRERIAPIAAQVFDRARAAGVIRDDLGHFDVPMFNFAIGYVAENTRDVSPDYWRRLLTVVLDGMRPAREDATPLPIGPLTVEEYQAAIGATKP